jgi:hypothetical protein
VQARLNNLAIDFSLVKKVAVARCPIRVHWQRHVEFRDMNLKPQGSQARDVGGDGGGIEFQVRNMHLQTHPIDGHAALFEGLHHRVDCV